MSVKFFLCPIYFCCTMVRPSSTNKGVFLIEKNNLICTDYITSAFQSGILESSCVHIPFTLRLFSYFAMGTG